MHSLLRSWFISRATLKILLFFTDTDNICAYQIQPRNIIFQVDIENIKYHARRKQLHNPSSFFLLLISRINLYNVRNADNLRFSVRYEELIIYTSTRNTSNLCFFRYTKIIFSYIAKRTQAPLHIS